ncbi:polyubiquitin-C [Ceratobasidium sp. AG-Ba]|nr:polyubiquitin-C [Ceratobasidium sp. AG-Ba]
MSNNNGKKMTAQNGMLPFIVATHAGDSATIRRNSNYGQTIALIKSAFEDLASHPAERIHILTKFAGYNRDIRVTQDLWAELIPSITEVTVKEIPPKSSSAARNLSTFTITQFFGSPFTIQAELTDTIEAIKRKIQETQDSRTLNDYNVPLGATLSLDMLLKKPVIYLFPPAPLFGVDVHLSLPEACKFSTLYPPTPIHSTQCGAEYVNWTVDAKSDGILFDQGTRREVSYLFWEASTKPRFSFTPPVSRPGSPTQELSIFDPGYPVITLSNGVVLPVAKVTSYIDDTLIALGLHTEARSSFITYWLPDLQHHKFIALRFLPQSEYEAAVPLSISPSPDVVTRVFMVFRGVKEADVTLWSEAQSKSAENPVFWRDIVGVDLVKAQNSELFRVVEWGGMEVK